MKPVTQSRKKWRSWLKRIYNDIQFLLISKHIYDEIGNIYLTNKEIQEPADFHDWVIRNYGISSSVTIRRLTDNRRDSISLIRLLGEIRDTPDAISRRSYVRWYNANMKWIGKKRFDQLNGNKALSHLSKTIIEKDIKQIIKSAKRIRRFVDTQVAHLDQKNKKRKYPTFNELDNSIFTIERIFLKYQELLTGTSPQTLLPIWSYDWKTIFKTSWLKTKNTNAA